MAFFGCFFGVFWVLDCGNADGADHVTENSFLDGQRTNNPLKEMDVTVAIQFVADCVVMVSANLVNL